MSKYCSICQSEIDVEPNGWSQGHNAQPINNGRCCSSCNNLVIAARLRLFTRATQSDEGIEVDAEGSLRDG